MLVLLFGVELSVFNIKNNLHKVYISVKHDGSIISIMNQPL